MSGLSRLSFDRSLGGKCLEDYRTRVFMPSQSELSNGIFPCVRNSCFAPAEF